MEKSRSSSLRFASIELPASCHPRACSVPHRHGLPGIEIVQLDAAAALGDADTADLFTEVSRGLDKLLWKVETLAG